VQTAARVLLDMPNSSCKKTSFGIMLFAEQWPISGLLAVRNFWILCGCTPKHAMTHARSQYVVVSGTCHSTASAEKTLRSMHLGLMHSGLQSICRAPRAAQNLATTVSARGGPSRRLELYPAIVISALLEGVETDVTRGASGRRLLTEGVTRWLRR
jgi:hypothetical protein